MRLLSIFIISFTVLLSTGCSKGSAINGRSYKTALKSVSMIKDRLPQQQRIPFELSFWAIRTKYRKNGDFLDIVDGKTPDELIAVGKEVFEARKAEGFAEYQQYATWEDMIQKYTNDRRAQNAKKKRDPRDGANSVLYKL
jgi:hypothetical protein